MITSTFSTLALHETCIVHSTVYRIFIHLQNPPRSYIYDSVRNNECHDSFAIRLDTELLSYIRNS